jgi:signal transduction histidine kinase
MTALRTAIDVAQERDRTPDEYRELLDDLAEECSTLSKLVNQLLLLAEGEGGQLKPGETVVRLDEVTAKAVDMFRGVAEQSDVDLGFEPLAPAPVRGEVSHLRQIIHNLIDNAIKFTPPGGRVSVEVFADHDTGAVLRVRDTGIGISAEDLPRVFDRFYRADRARRRERAGTGLGLSICQAIVSAYGGTITAAGAPGEGATFTVTLPLAQKQPV